MSSLDKVFENAKILLLTEVLNVFAGVATVIVLARLVDINALGLYSLSYSLGSVLAIICLYGANQLITREVARFPDKLEFWVGNSLAVRAGIALSLFLILGVLFTALDYGRERILIASLLILARVIESILMMFCAIFRGYQEMRYDGALRSVQSGANLAIGLPILILTRSLLLFAAFQAVSCAIVTIAAYLLVIRRYRVSPTQSVSWPACVQVFREGLSFSAYSILLVLFVQTNTIMLSLFKGDQDTGLYTAGFRFVSALGMGAASVTSALYPAVALLTLRDHAEEIRQIYLRCTKYLWILASFFSTALFLFAPEIVHLTYGARYASAVAGVKIMAFSLFFSYMNVSSTNLLFCLDQEKLALKILTFSTALVLVINLVMIPRLGFIGASWTTLIPEIAVSALLALALKRSFGRLGTMKLAAQFAGLAALVCGPSLYWAALPLPARILLFLALYFAGIFLMRIAAPQNALKLARRKMSQLEVADVRG